METIFKNQVSNNLTIVKAMEIPNFINAQVTTLTVDGECPQELVTFVSSTVTSYQFAGLGISAQLEQMFANAKTKPYLNTAVLSIVDFADGSQKQLVTLFDTDEVRHSDMLLVIENICKGMNAVQFHPTAYNYENQSLKPTGMFWKVSPIFYYKGRQAS